MRLEVALCAALLAVAGCKKSSDLFKVDTDIRRDPGLITVSLRVRDSASKPVDGAQIELEGNMTHPGMAPVFGAAGALGDGRYRGSLPISMAGDWVVSIHGRLASGTLIEREILVK